MARPIEPTPPLVGEDAEQLLEELRQHVPREEMNRRIEEAKRLLEFMERPKRPPATIKPSKKPDPR